MDIQTEIRFSAYFINIYVLCETLSSRLIRIKTLFGSSFVSLVRSGSTLYIINMKLSKIYTNILHLKNGKYKYKYIPGHHKMPKKKRKKSPDQLLTQYI